MDQHRAAIAHTGTPLLYVAARGRVPMGTIDIEHGNLTGYVDVCSVAHRTDESYTVFVDQLAMADWLAARRVRLVVCAGYMRILPPAFLERFAGQVINVHPSLLPAFKGAHPIEDALAAGASETGVTVHWVDEGVDTGPAIVQERVAVDYSEMPEALRARIQAVEHRLLPATVRKLARELEAVEEL